MIKAFNYSDVFGGQERYLSELAKWMILRNYGFKFEGRPIGLIASSIDNTSASVHLYNGNSALYKSIRGVDRSVLNVYVQHSHIDDGQQILWRRWVRKALVRLLLLKFDLVVRVCDAALPSKYAPGKIVTIYNGVDVPESSGGRKGCQAKRWLMVGGVTANKNQKLAIDALKCCPSATLTIVGNGPERKSLELYAMNIGVSDRVFWEGFVEDPERYYQECDVLLMLSHYEAFPYVVLEAMAHGMPVVATRVGGVPEILNQQNGILLNDWSVKELVDSVNMLSMVAERYESISRCAVETIRQGFTRDHCFGKLLDCIQQRIKQKSKDQL